MANRNYVAEMCDGLSMGLAAFISEASKRRASEEIILLDKSEREALAALLTTFLKGIATIPNQGQILRIGFMTPQPGLNQTVLDFDLEDLSLLTVDTHDKKPGNLDETIIVSTGYFTDDEHIKRVAIGIAEKFPQSLLHQVNAIATLIEKP